MAKSTTKAAPKAETTKAAPAKAGKSAASAKGGSGPHVVGTITLKNLAQQITDKHEMVNKKQAETMLNDMVGMMTEHLRNGDRLRIGGLGILQIKERAARMGRNPATGAAIQIKASKKIAFRPAKELKDAMLG